MESLTSEMKQLITHYNAASVATINSDGTPAVSPKATFIIIDDKNIAFGNIRSPGTVSNIQSNPNVELNFIDVLARKAIRIKGLARVINKNTEEGMRITPAFQNLWEPYINRMKNYIGIAITHTELIMSPAYDIGLTEIELQKTNLDKLTKLIT